MLLFELFSSVASGDCSLVEGCGLLVAEHRLQWLWYTGSAALWHVASSQTRDQTCVSCIGRQILYHGATEEALECPFFKI